MNPPTHSIYWELPVLIVIAFVLALLIKSFLVQAFYIPSESMDPTLKIGDRVLVEKVLTHPHRGWIIVFTNPHPVSQPDRGVVSGFFNWLSAYVISLTFPSFVAVAGIGTAFHRLRRSRRRGLPGRVVAGARNQGTQPGIAGSGVSQ